MIPGQIIYPILQTCINLPLACSRRSDSRAREKNSRRQKKGGTRGGKGERTPVNIPLQSSFRPLSSAEASLCCGEAFVLWGGWGERKRERGGHDFPLPIVPRALSIFSIIDILMGIPSGALCGGESFPPLIDRRQFE